MKLRIETEPDGTVRKHVPPVGLQDAQSFCGLSFIWGREGSIEPGEGIPDCPLCLQMLEYAAKYQRALRKGA